MSRFTVFFRRAGIGCGGLTLVLGVVGATWLRHVYVLPPEPPLTASLPSPNGYQTALAACQLEVKEKDGVKTWYPKDKKPSLAARKALLDANAASIAKLREALGQEWLTPPVNEPNPRNPEYAQFREEARMLCLLGAETLAEEGKLAEAAHCATDAVELGVLIPRGGILMTSMVGNVCEKYGASALWRLADQLDAPTARATQQRLAAIEKRRWPFAQTLDAEKHAAHLSMRAFYGKGPLQTWRNIDQSFDVAEKLTGMMGSVIGTEAEEPSLTEKWKTQWARTGRKLTVIASGPKTYERNLDPWLDAVAAASEKPWGMQLPAPPADPTGMLLAPVYPQAELKVVRARAELALLQTYLALRVYWLEKGIYPKTLEALGPTLPDPFSSTGAPLRYENGTLWSLGKDVKMDARESSPGLEKKLP